MRQKGLARALCFAFYEIEVQNARGQITRGGRSKRAWSGCVFSIPFTVRESSNECCLHTCCAWITATWRLILRAPQGARNKFLSIRYTVVVWYDLTLTSLHHLFSSALRCDISRRHPLERNSKRHTQWPFDHLDRHLSPYSCLHVLHHRVSVPEGWFLGRNWT